MVSGVGTSKITEMNQSHQPLNDLHVFSVLKQKQVSVTVPPAMIYRHFVTSLLLRTHFVILPSPSYDAWTYKQCWILLHAIRKSEFTWYLDKWAGTVGLLFSSVCVYKLTSAIQSTRYSSIKLLKYWSRNSRPGPRKAKSWRCISLLVICATYRVNYKNLQLAFNKKGSHFYTLVNTAVLKRCLTYN